MRPELECLGQICSLQDHNTPIENNPIERRNSLEQELDDEDNFDWSSLESEVQEGLAEGAASHADRTPYNLSANRSTPFLRRKPSAKSLRRLYLESGPFRDLYLEKTPLPPVPEPLFAFPTTFNTSPPDDRPTADQVDSIFDMIFDVAKRSREPSMDLGGISDILSEAGARLRREKGLRDPSKENTPRPKSPVSLMSFGSAETLLSHESPSKEGVPNPKSPVSPRSRGPPLNPFSQRRLSSRRAPRPDTPVSPFSGGAPVSSLPRGISSRERLPVPEVPVSPLSLGSAVNPFPSRPSSRGEARRPETPISPLSVGPPTIPLPSGQPSLGTVPRLEIPVSPPPCSSPVKPLYLGRYKPRKRLRTTVRPRPGESLDGEPEPSDAWAMFHAVCQDAWQDRGD